MVELLPALGFGLAVGFMIIGLIGIVVPLMPGILLMWLTALTYGLIDGFDRLSPQAFALLTLVALATGTADLWMPLLGAKSTGAAKRSLMTGIIGGLLGMVFFSLIGAIVGYALGIIVGEYWKHQNWNQAMKASVGGVAGWGVATAIQLGGGIVIILIFAVSILVN